MFDHTSNNRSHRNSDKKFKEKFESHIWRKFNIFCTKTTVLGKSHVIREVLQSEYCTLSGGDHRWFKRNAGEKRPVTRHDIGLI